MKFFLKNENENYKRKFWEKLFEESIDIENEFISIFYLWYDELLVLLVEVFWISKKNSK